MYAFSVNAKTARPVEGFSAGQEVPFIVYINFKDLYGAEQLCKLYLQQQDFFDIDIEKRKLIEARFLSDSKLLDADKALREAVDTGYSIQIFNAH